VSWLFTVMATFIEYPLLAAAIGALLFALGSRLRRKGLTAAGIFWLLYAAYETGMQQRWLCSGECNIRVDLLLIYPALLVATLVGVINLLRARRAPLRS
jgi:hypothetical protein